jgi:phospholipase C
MRKQVRSVAIASCVVAFALGACNDDEDHLAKGADGGSADAAVLDSGIKPGMDASQTSLDAAVDAAAPDASATVSKASDKLKHLVVIYLENHSFDNLYGSWDGVEGLSAATSTATQTDPTTSLPFVTLPQMDMHVPTTLENKPFDITQYVPANQKTIDLVHRFYQEQKQINGGKMDLFAAVSDAKGLSMGFYPTAQLPLAIKLKTIPNQVTVFDHFFHAAFGGSFLNHMWLIAAASPEFKNAPDAMVAKLGPDGYPTTDGAVTPDGYVVNTSYTVNAPHPASAPTANLVPNQTFPTIGDRLMAKNVDFAWYSGGWDDALAGTPDPLFQFHHQPFAFFQTFADGTAAKEAHLKDEKEFLSAVQTGALPPVSFVKPIGADNEHPGYADVIKGENHTVELVNAVMASPTWNDTAILITYDEHGGYWDHVAPPKTDKWGPGLRVPTILISPFAKGGVDKTTYDTTAILKLIDERWGTEPLNARVTGQASLIQNAFNFSK